jgi:surface carbohydrate biosynthesis protein
MNQAKPMLLIPVENQVRELDPKLLLACKAAERGFSSIVGSRREIEFNITSFPKSIYISKSIKSGNGRFFRILRKLGHDVVAWDEEALVHLPRQIYYSRRLCPKAMKFVSHLFAWGEDNAEMWRMYDSLPASTPIHVTGNPRVDLLRPEIRPFYQSEAEKLGAQYGEFILINTNFNHVNAFSPFQNLFLPCTSDEEGPGFGEAAKGMTRKYAEGLRAHKQALFENFQQMIPVLNQALENTTIVVRPHPTENPEVYRQIADQCRRVQVSNKGNIVPWLMATRTVIHNGCTTGLEAFVMGVPAISYRPTIDDDYDMDFYRLPNSLSHQCFNLEELQELLGKILAGDIGLPDEDKIKSLVERHLTGLQGPLASERIVDTLHREIGGQRQSSEGGVASRLHGRYLASRRKLKKRFKALLPTSINRPEFQRHRYPEVPVEEIRVKISKFQQLLGNAGDLKLEQLSSQFYRISP